jgi:DnaJ-class molecular chaperone
MALAMEHLLIDHLLLRPLGANALQGLRREVLELFRQGRDSVSADPLRGRSRCSACEGTGLAGTNGTKWALQSISEECQGAGGQGIMVHMESKEIVKKCGGNGKAPPAHSLFIFELPFV